jgi:hypothetical protein
MSQHKNVSQVWSLSTICHQAKKLSQASEFSVPGVQLKTTSLHGTEICPRL